MAVITIANETGCGLEFYTTLATMLGYRLVNKELVQYVASLADIDLDNAEKLDEKNHTKFNAIVSEYFNMNLFQTESFQKTEQKPSLPYEYSNDSSGQGFRYAMEKVIRVIANDGNAILVGRGGFAILKEHPEIYHIKLIADIETRAANISKSMGLSYAESVKYAQSTDNKKNSFLKHYFEENMNNDLNFHYIINLSKTNEKIAAGLFAKIF